MVQTIEITNSLGQIVLNDEMNCKEKSHSINTKLFVSGIYSIKVSQKDFYSKVSKLVIQR